MAIKFTFFYLYKYSCYLALGNLEDASRNYMSYLNSNTLSSNPKMFTEASNGLEKVKVSSILSFLFIADTSNIHYFYFLHFISFLLLNLD